VTVRRHAVMVVVVCDVVGSFIGMPVLLALVVLVLFGAVLFGGGWLVVARRTRRERERAGARDEALGWYQRLGAQVMIPASGQPPVRQAMADAGDLYVAAGVQLRGAKTRRQYAETIETVVEGLWYVRAAKLALGVDPGPQPPRLTGQQAAGKITKDREVEVDGQCYRASAEADARTPHFYPGGMIFGRRVPSGWYSEPWWRPALAAGAWGVRGVLVFDALLSPAWGDSGYDAGYRHGPDFSVDD
jgi:hypothetical protein